MSEETEDAPPARPTLRIVKGDPTPEEIAVLTALVAVVSADAAPPAPRERRGGWNDPSVLHRGQLIPGPNAWRAATW